MIPYTARKLSQTTRQIPRSLPLSSLPAPTDIPGCLSFIQKQAHTINPLSQNNYLILQKWLGENVLTAVKEIAKGRDKGKGKAGLYEVFRLCAQVKVYRSGVFGVLEENREDMGNYSLMELVKIYETAIYLKHPGQTDFITQLRSTILHKLKTRESVDKVSLPYLLSFLSSLALDPSLPNLQKSCLLAELSPVLQNSMPLFNQYRRAKMSTFSTLFEQAKLYGIQVLPAFGEILEEANRGIDAGEDRQGKEEKGEMGRDSYYFSTFEKIFQNALTGLGYSFNLNTLIKGNEYDIIITGKNKEKHCPLANTALSSNLQSHPPMPLQKVKLISQSKNIEWHESHQPLQKVVLALNGPIHYINSDVHGRNAITRREEFQYEKLVLYGIGRYAMICYEDWWKISRHTRQIEQFIQQRVDNPVLLAKRE